MRIDARRGLPLSWVTRKLMLKGFWVLTTLSLLVTAAVGVQRFQERPQDTSVIQGQTVVLKCAVENRVGQIQWVKDGFALGYDRNIPGFATYSIIGNDFREYNLMIVNTQLEDDADFQCQVGPGGSNEARLTASAKLTVLVPCEVPVIQGYQNASVVEVPFTRRSLQLVCEARHGRPAAEIEWFRNEQKVVQNIDYVTEVIEGDKRQNARSTLSLQLHGNTEDNAMYRCQAKNSAVTGHPLSTVVTISILYPPGPPVIEGYNDGQVVRTNDTVLLSCMSRGGNPLGTVVWYRNNDRVDSSFTSGGNKAINEYTFTAASTDNGVAYRCEVTNLMTQDPLAASRTLIVHFPPSRVTISGGSGPLRAGDTVELTCVSSNSNPRSTITWFARGRQIPDGDVTNTFQPSPLGGFVTRSKVTVTLSHQEHNVIYTCQATNDVGQTVADTVTLSVLYPPNPPTISGYEQGASIRANELERLTCIAVGGNPVAVLKWYKNDQLLTEAQYSVIGNIAQAEIGIVARPDDNGAVYKCAATNAAITTPLVDTVTLTVLFPPTSVLISASNSQPRSGQGMNLTCTCSSSNPAAEILWVKGGKRIQGVNRGVVDAENGGKNTTNVLHFIPTSSDHNAVYGCRATNTLLGLSVNDAVTLTVLFPPEFSTSLQSTIEMTENESQNINMSAYAYPPAVTYSLTREGLNLTLPSDLPRFRLSNDGVLRISSIDKNDKGNFMIRAQNGQGFSTFNFTIVVKYSATILDITSRVLADEGGTAFFECVASAHPTTPNMVTWTRPDYNMSSKTKQRIEGTKAYLTVYELTREDTGNFKCIADNGIGEPATRTAKLVVKYAPIINKSPENSKAASNKGETATLTCQAEGAPDITFTWYKDGVEIDLSNSKFQTDLDKSRTIEYTGTLRIRNVANMDYGTYNCTATNVKGSDSFLVSLHGTSKPDPPYDLQFVNATHNSITIRWKPGFNGGLEQSYRVRYKPTEARGYIYIDVSTPVSTLFTITGLKLGTEYEMTVLAFNSLGESAFLAQGITAKTSSVIPPSDISTSELQGSDEVPVIIILVVCIVGVFLLTLNVGLILFFVRRRRKRLENASDTTSHTNTFELYSSSKAETALYPVAASDDQRSYGTYDKNMDDFSDEFNREYEPEYVNRPYTPTKMDSPHMSNSHKTYIMENHDRESPWQEDPYRVAMPPHKKGVYDNGDILYDHHTFPRGDTRPKSITELSDRPGSRPSSRAGKTPPAPPMRTSSRGDTLPPVPARNYGPQEIQPRYAPPPGSLSPNIVTNPTYNGPNRLSPTHNHLAPGSEMRGHLV